MRMKDQHDHIERAGETVAPTSTTRPHSASLGEKAIEWTTVSSRPQSFPIRSKTALHLAGLADVQRHEDRCFELLRQRATNFFAFSLR